MAKKSSRGTQLSPVPPPQAVSLQGFHAFHACAAPLQVPERVSYQTAVNLFDRSTRIFMVPIGTIMWPEDYSRRFTYSFTWADWWRNILKPSDARQWASRRLFEVWDRILAYAKCQAHMNPAEQTGNVRRYLDFYHFVDPEVQIVDAAPPNPSKPFELRWADRGGYFYYTFFSPGVPPNGQDKRRRKV